MRNYRLRPLNSYDIEIVFVKEYLFFHTKLYSINLDFTKFRYLKEDGCMQKLINCLY